MLAVGCNGITHNAAEIPVAGIGRDLQAFTYSNVGSLSGTNNYDGFTLFDDGTFEVFATTYTTTNGVTSWTGWYKIAGTYTKDATDIHFNGAANGGTGDVLPCGTSFVVSIPYTETADTITMAPHTYTLETTSGLSRPDVSSMPNTCP
ncbi:hypothetical protein [Peredibacter starrii]|uniref:Lipoprotein n=1 Tax=Peredibacter starrii TaxID=28202 RepID=A0AAX4HPV8_9BACT|nr:hypothetical protein [Peredibacter starrii]WPU65146.1 hypothetical protein SOO65_00085 [Peredibacter starrii]